MQTGAVEGLDEQDENVGSTRKRDAFAQRRSMQRSKMYANVAFLAPGIARPGLLQKSDEWCSAQVEGRVRQESQRRLLMSPLLSLEIGADLVHASKERTYMLRPPSRNEDSLVFLLRISGA